MSEQQPAGAPRALRILALVAVCVGVAALAAAAFVFSYTGIHAVALQAGVNTRLARGYPLILDVLLVVILAAVLALRSAGWPSKLLAWISLLALLAAAAGADALHAAGDRLPVRTAEITVAVLPWALVLIAFVLLLAMLRQARIRRHGQAGEQPRQPKWQPQEPPPLARQPLVPGFPAPAGPAPAEPTLAGPTLAGQAHAPHDTLRLVIPRQVAPETAADGRASGAAAQTAAASGAANPDTAPETAAASGAANPDTAPEPASAGEPAAPAAEPADGPGLAFDTGDLALDAEFMPDDPSSDEAALEPAADADPDAVPQTPGPQTPGPQTPGPQTPVPQAPGPEAPAPRTSETDGAEAGSADEEMPVFHRMWSSPVPPESE